MIAQRLRAARGRTAQLQSLYQVLKEKTPLDFDDCLDVFLTPFETIPVILGGLLPEVGEIASYHT